MSSVGSIPKTVQTCEAARELVRQAHMDGKRVGVVMTMGALHTGHLSLVEACWAECDVCVVTIFVNPTQFCPNEDFEKYPRELEADLRLLQNHNVNFVFAPDASEMYREGSSTVVQAPACATHLEGAHRKGHFEGVCTIVLKLLHAVPADKAFFGQKDYQQCAVVKNMVADLNVGTEIVVCPTKRADDGLALSSRNRYLSDEERERALSINRALRHAADQVADGETDVEAVRSVIEATIADAADSIDYVAIVDAESLEEVERFEQRSVALVACHVGSTRLIDNWILEPKE